MTAQELKKILEKDGITIELKGEQFSLRPKSRVNNYHKKLVSLFKDKILAEFQGVVFSEKNKNNPLVRKYEYSGEVLELGNGEFEKVVDLFRLLKKWRDEKSK